MAKRIFSDLRTPQTLEVGMIFRRMDAGRTNLADLQRVEELVRDQFTIGPRDIVLVSEDPGSKPGFPPRETNVVFWKAGARFRLRIFAPVSQVTQADLPVSWLLPAFRDNGDADCC